MARRTQDTQSLRLGLIFLGELVLAVGRYPDAAAIFSEALTVCRRLGEPYTTALCLQRLGVIAMGQGDYDRARDLLGAALAMEREGDAPIALTHCLTARGWLEHGLGRLSAASGHFEEARLIAEAAGFESFPALHGLAEVALAEARWRDAEALFDQAGARLRPDARSVRAALTSGLGRLARARGDMRRATMLAAEALALRHQGGELPHVTESLEDMAPLAVEADQFERAARLFAAAQAVRDANGYARPPVLQAAHATDIRVVKKRLGSRRFQAVWREGQAMSLEEAVALALKGRGARKRAQTGWSSLTRSERSITALVAKGLTNKEIGERLFVSPRTVETHLTRIFSKLGLSSRRELAKAAAQRGL